MGHGPGRLEPSVLRQSKRGQLKSAEPKWDGYRAQLARYRDGHVLLRSRRGTDMTPAFPEIRATAAQLPDDDTALDGGV
ncbi:hypothetical protein OG933_05120 [Streptomyces sp. NBC_00016]|uniref:ATP-dependent DNA ligase n=1 Tax=Streptomyces sp. NBC_00016 TaxID=2975622 RepID=UPI00324416D6